MVSWIVVEELWIMKVSGPTKTLHMLNAEVALITVRADYQYG